MEKRDLVLVAATYADAEAAQGDFAAVEDVRRKGGQYEVLGAVVLGRDGAGDVKVTHHGAHEAAGGAVVGGGVGLVVGLLAPPLLAATVIGGGIGAAIGGLSRRHEEKQLGMDLAEIVPHGSTAVVLVVEARHADAVEAALAHATKTSRREVDGDDAETLRQALEGAELAGS